MMEELTQRVSNTSFEKEEYPLPNLKYPLINFLQGHTFKPSGFFQQIKGLEVVSGNKKRNIFLFKLVSS